MTKQQWELRTNGIRLSGDTFLSWRAATEAARDRMQRLYYDAFHEGQPVRGSYVGAKIATWDASIRLMRREVPRGQPTIALHKHGLQHTFQVNRIPW